MAIINTTLCYIEQDGCWLMMHRVKKKNDLNQDKWIGIGGKIEDGESPEEANLREAYEETGLTLTDARLRGIITFVTDQNIAEYMFLFSASQFTGTLREDCDEGDLVWVPKEQVFRLPLWEGDPIFLHKLEENVPFFSLKLCYEGDKLVESKFY